MILLTIAHPGEAQEFLKNDDFEQCPFALLKVYRSHKEWLLMTGEGIRNSIEKISTVCQTFSGRVEKIINLGVASGLDQKLKLDHIYSVRNCFREDHAIAPLSTDDDSASIDCITANQRILDINLGNNLATIAPMADMECWAQASIAKKLNLPFYSYKIISDSPSDRDIEKQVKMKAAVFGQKIHAFYRSMVPV